MFTEPLRRILRAPIEQVAARFLAFGIRPQWITAIPPLVSVTLIAPLVACGQVGLALFLVLLVFPLDALDGKMAKLAGQAGKLGRLADLTADRVCDGSLLAGITIFAAGRHGAVPVCSAAAATFVWGLQSQLTVSGDALGVAFELGPFQRTERLAILMVGLVAAALGAPLGLWLACTVVVLGALVSIFRRYAAIRRVLLNNA